MCGICGWIDSEEVDRSILEKMTKSMCHRGPDAQQFEILENAGLGHTRLSIIDLSEEGNQPICNEDKSLYLVYNGEFYNFKEYKDELIQRGHIFKSKTDSEVILHLYEEEGTDCLNRIRGMFAFALWDRKKEKLVLARDRVGIKPLYYHHDGNKFLFASELKGILKHPDVSKELDEEALHTYFVLGYIPGSMSIFKDIKKLLPGHYLTICDYEVVIRKYWELPEIDSKYNYIDEDSIIDELYSILNEAVRLRLISDVPLGVFLSGGVDSSIVAALAAKNSNLPIKTFSIGFDIEKYSELTYARLVADHIGAEHHEFVVSIDEADIVNKLAYYFDEPFADSSAIPTYYVSKKAREFVTVALSGDGGDELFGGYNWYHWVLNLKRTQFLPLFIKRLVSKTAGIYKDNYKGKHFLSVFGMSEFEAFRERVGFFSDQEINVLLKSNFSQGNYDSFGEFYKNAGNSPLERMSKTDFSFYLPHDILTKVDRASMAVSLEARVPILDHKVCEFAYSLKDNLKIRRNKKKYLLKKLAKRLLPDSLPIDRKQGFSIPLKEWMQGKMGDEVLNAINSQNVHYLINSRIVENLLSEHRAGVDNHGHKLWAIMMFALWSNEYL